MEKNWTIKRRNKKTCAP